MSKLEFPQFATPHCHPHSLDSGSTPEAFALREVALGSKTLTCTDHGTLEAAYQVYNVAKKGPVGYETEHRKWPGLIPIVGLEAYFRDDDDPILKSLGIPKTSARPKGVDSDEWASQHPDGLSYLEYLKYTHATLHFADWSAYLAAVKLLSKADARAERHGSERKPLFGWAEIEELAALNVTMGSSCLIGMVQRHLFAYQDMKTATLYLDRLHHLFGDRFFVEAFPHRCTHNFIDAVFIDVVDAVGVEQKLRYYPGKHLRLVDTAGTFKEIYASGMTAFWKSKGKSDFAVIATMNYRKWEDLSAPLKIVGVDTTSGFVQNECAPHAPDGDVQWGCNRFIIEMAKRRGIPIMASDDSHFATVDEKVVQDVRLTTPNSTWLMYSSYHRQSSAEAYEYFRRYQGVTAAEFQGWVENSLAWAERFKGFKFDSSPKLPNKFFPEDTLAHTKHLIEVHGRLAGTPAEMKRLGTEIDILHRNGKLDLLPYFFIDEEICDLYAINWWITGPGRGSAAGVLLTKLLGVTHLDPLAYDLSLERFITADRIRSGKMPDIDQDLPFREPLEGWDIDVVEFVAADGTKHVVPEKMKFRTSGIPMTADEAVATGAEFMAWWLMAPPRPIKATEILRRSRGQKAKPEEPAYLKPRYQGWLSARFGDHYAQISVDHTLKLKNAVKDVHRARHGVVPGEIHAWCKQFEESPQGLPDFDFVVGYENDEGVHPGSITRDKALQEYSNTYPEDFEIVKKCLGLARHKSSHPCAFVIADRPISDFIPLTRPKSGDQPITAYTAAGVEASGGLKMDFLVVNSIGDIQSAMNLIRERYPAGTDAPALVPPHQLVRLPDGGAADIWDLPRDPEVFKDFLRGSVETVFQYHTKGARDWMRYFARKRADGSSMIADIRDLAIFTALDRPGPLDIELSHPEAPDQKHNALVEYTRRAAGKQGSSDILPVMNDLLPKTHGVMVFQEQLQYTYQQLTGCSGPEAEDFRSNVAKKLKVKVDAAYPGFMERAAVKLGSREAAQGAWDMFSTWGQYGFNLSHATCYAVIGYACAYLKHHYPMEWWCGLLRNADKGEVNTEFWPYVRHWVDLPDVGTSGDNWDIKDGRLVWLPVLAPRPTTSCGSTRRTAVSPTSPRRSSSTRRTGRPRGSRSTRRQERSFSTRRPASP